MTTISRRVLEEKAREMLAGTAELGPDGVPVGIAASKFNSVLDRLVTQRAQQLQQQGVRVVD